MGRRPCCAKEGIRRGAWTVLEDKILSNYIEIHGEGKWRDLPQRAGLKRCGKSCRLRWMNYLKSDIKRGNISVEEEELIIKLHNLLGNRWSLIAGRLPGRTDNEIKNYWNTKLSKRIKGPQKTQDSTKQLHKLKEKESEGKFSTALIPENLQLAIRPKAVRVTKVIIPQQLGHNNQMIKKNEVPTWDHNSSLSYSTLLEVEDDTPFLMDIDIGELFISDVLRSETHQEIEERNKNDNGGGGDYGDMNLPSGFDFMVSSFEDFLNNSTEESMMENWRGW